MCWLILIFLSGSLSAMPDSAEVVALENEQLVHPMLDRASLYLQQNDYEVALSELLQAYELTREQETSPLFVEVLNALATAYFDAGQLDQAQRYYEHALLQEPDPGANRMLTLYNLAHVRASMGDYLLAHELLEDSLAIAQDRQDIPGQAYALKALGANAMAMNRFNQARDYLGAALDQFATLDDSLQEAHVYRHLGDIAEAEGNASAAIQLYLSALPVYLDLSNDSGLMRLYRGLSAAYEKQGNLENAQITQKAYAILNEEILLNRQQESTQRMQVAFETRRYADENDDLQLENREQQQALDLQNTLLEKQRLVNILSAGVIALVILLFVRSHQFGRRMQALATTDELTGLFNRRAILEKGVYELMRARRFDRPFSCFMFDIDHFKSINDTYGHEVGDKVLKKVAGEILATLRQSDCLGRIGGKSFC